MHRYGGNRNKALTHLDAGTRRGKVARMPRAYQRVLFQGQIAPRVKSVYPTGKVFPNRPQGAFLRPERVDTMKTTNTNRKPETAADEKRPYCAGERCNNCPHADTCRMYWGGNSANWDTFTDAEITRAVELMISPDDLTIRGAALALFAVFGYTPEDVREQLDRGEYFNAGAVFAGLGTPAAQIITPEE